MCVNCLVGLCLSLFIFEHFCSSSVYIFPWKSNLFVSIFFSQCIVNVNDHHLRHRFFSTQRMCASEKRFWDLISRRVRCIDSIFFFSRLLCFDHFHCVADEIVHFFLEIIFKAYRRSHNKKISELMARSIEEWERDREEKYRQMRARQRKNDDMWNCEKLYVD